MRSVTKIGIASLALLGTVASVAPAADAQGYGYGYGRGYGYGYGVGNGPTPGYCGPHTSQMTNWILDPQTGQPITQDQYLARHPWSNPGTWSYSCETGLWTDPGTQANAYQGPGYYSQGPAYRSNGRGYHRQSWNDNYGQGRGHQRRNG